MSACISKGQLTVGRHRLQEAIRLEGQYDRSRGTRRHGPPCAPILTKIQPHSRLFLPLLANCNVQRRVSSEAIPNVGVAAVVVKQVLENVCRSVHDTSRSAQSQEPAEQSLRVVKSCPLVSTSARRPQVRCNSPVLPSLRASALPRSLFNPLNHVQRWQGPKALEGPATANNSPVSVVNIRQLGEGRLKELLVVGLRGSEKALVCAVSTRQTRTNTREPTCRSAVLLRLLWRRGRGGAAGGAHVVGDRGNEVMWKMSQGCLEVVSLVSRLCAASSGAHHPLTQHVAFEAGLSPSSPERLGDVISRLPLRSHRVVTLTRSFINRYHHG